ncbi:hypothetical protein F5146DRAFT_1024065 [Armillaria mellea]|nr:hypothetical protein F5146DRAFT_1024065 [Armillaria mellea]
MAARHAYTLEDPTNGFVEIASALIHDCLVGIEHGGTTFSNRRTLVSLSIQSADLQGQRCLSRLAELRDEIFNGREVLDQLRHALRWVSEDEPARWGHGTRSREFHLRFHEFVREIRQRLGEPGALRGHRERIRAFLGVRTRADGARAGDRREAAVLYDTLQGLDALLHNHGNILPRLISLDDQDSAHSEELIMARDVICGILPGPSILTFETAVRKFFVPLLATSRFFRERQELGQLCERVAFGEREAVDALDEARRILRRIAEPPQPQTPARRHHGPATRHHIHHLHWCRDSTACRRRETARAEPRGSQSSHHPPFNPPWPYPITPFYTPPPSPVAPPDPPPHTHLTLQMVDLFIGHDRHFVQS